jgi:hypothetical protein
MRKLQVFVEIGINGGNDFVTKFLYKNGANHKKNNSLKK